MTDDRDDVIERLRSVLAHAREKRQSSGIIQRIMARFRARIKRNAVVETIETEKKKPETHEDVA